MRLLLDLGNTRAKWALVDEAARIVQVGVAGREPSALLAALPAGAEPGAVAISSVGPGAVRDVMASSLANRFGCAPTLLATRAECAGLKNGYREPGRLGVDRWLAMLGAHSLATGPFVVVDAGTAMTVDAVDARGQHLGGYIVPGLHLQCDALNLGTAGVGPAGAAGRGWGRDTGAAVGNGVLLSLAALAERAQVELGGGVEDTCALFLTGGDAGRLSPLLTVPHTLSAELVFLGMLVQLGWKS